MSQNDSSTTPLYGGPQTGLSGRGSRFFDWMRTLGVVRTDGWVGGVCAGVAYKLGIDPLIVRGIVIIVALFGAPAVLIYALAWALLPDSDGRIHLQRLFRGEVEAPIVAIGVLLLLSLLPWSSGPGWFDGGLWSVWGWAQVVGRVFWTLLVLTLAAGLVVLAVRTAGTRPAPPTAHAPSGGGDGSTTVSADAGTDAPQTDSPAASPAPASEDSQPAAPPLHPLDITAEPVAPPAPPPGAAAEDVADWQRRQAEWKADHARWKARLAEDMRAVKAQRAAELRSQAAAANAAARAQRAAYRAANPRVGGAFGWLAVGIAIISAAVVSSLWTPLTGVSGYTFTASLASVTLVFGLGALVAGLARRRSGFFITFGIILALLTALAAVFPAHARASLAAGSIVTTAGQTLTPAADARYVQGWGATTIDLSTAVAAEGTPQIDLVKGSDPTTLIVPADATVRIEAATPSPLTVTDPSGVTSVHRCTPRPLGACSTDLLVGPVGTPDALVRITQLDEVLVQREQK